MVDVARVIELVNDARRAMGLEPLEDLHKGTPNQGDTCPIANSLKNGHGVFVDSNRLLLFDDDYTNLVGRGVGSQELADHRVLGLERRIAKAWGTGWDAPNLDLGRVFDSGVRMPDAISEFISLFDDNDEHLKFYDEYEGGDE